jgi:hypothetical protein
MTTRQQRRRESRNPPTLVNSQASACGCRIDYFADGTTDQVWCADHSSHPRDDSMAIDERGRPLPMTSDQVNAHIRRMLDDGGDIIACIIVGKNGDIGMQVFGPPSKQLLDILETATASYRTALKGQG